MTNLDASSELDNKFKNEENGNAYQWSEARTEMETTLDSVILKDIEEIPSEFLAINEGQMNVDIPQEDSTNNDKGAVMIIEAPSNVVADFYNEESESRILKESETTIDMCQNDAVVDAPQNPQSDSLKDNGIEDASQTVAVDVGAAEDLNSESLKTNDVEIIKETSSTAIHKDLQDKDFELLKDKETEIINTIPSKIPIEESEQNNDFEVLKETEIVNNIPSNIPIEEAEQNNNSEISKTNDVEIIKETPFTAIHKDLQDKDFELLKDKETEIINTIPSNIPIEEAAQNNNSATSKTNDVEIIKETSSTAIHKDLQDKNFELLKDKETVIINNIPSKIPIEESEQNNISELSKNKEVATIEDAPSNVSIHESAQSSQDADSRPLKDNEIEIIKEAPRHVVVESISIDISSESSDDEFVKMIESAVQEAFVDNNSDSTQNKKEDSETDKPLKNITEETSKDYESESSDDDEFEKMIENVVQEAFQDNESSSPKSTEKDKDKGKISDDAHANVAKEISQNQIPNLFNMDVVEMSIDISQNEAVNEVSRDDIVRPFAQKKFKLECDSPESDESTVRIKEFAEEDNFGGEHAFSFTVSYSDNKDPQNCAAYSEPKNRLYISKEFEFQLLCSAESVPQGSILRACIHFAAPAEADKVVKRCAPHIREDILSGKRNAEHVIQSSHVEAQYEKDKESGRFNVMIPYQCSQGPFKGCAELSCYTYKFVCWSSCYRIMQRGFKVHFSLENNGMQLGKQVLDVKVCKCPEKEMEADSENPHIADDYPHAGSESPNSSNRMLKDFIIPALDSKKYGSLLHWGDESGVFFIKWIHKAHHLWSGNELAVFKDWDVLKGRPEAINSIDIVNSKQRVRAALRNIVCVKEMDCYEKEYRKYLIENIDFIRGSKSGLRRTKSLDSFEEVKQSKGERRTSRTVEPIAYEEAADDIVFDEEENYDHMPEPPAKKPRKLSPTKGKKKRKRLTCSKRRKKRPLSQSAKQIQSISKVARKSPSIIKKKSVTAKTRSSPSIIKKKSVGAKTRSNGKEQKLVMNGGFKKEKFSPKVELKRLTLQDLLQARVKMDTIKKYFGHNKDFKNQKNQGVKSIVLPPKSVLRRQQNRFMDHPVNAAVGSTREFLPVHRNVFANPGINFEATPYQIHAPTGQSPSPLSMPALSWKEDKPNKMLNTYSNIKTQGDMILAIIKAVLPSLQSDKVSEVYDYLVEMGVETADDLAYIEEDDLNKVLKPIQSRKLIAAWKNKGVPNHSASLPKRTCSAEPVTFVPAVFQIQNMTSPNQINDSHGMFSSKSESPHQSAVLNIPGWRQSTSNPSVQDVYPDLLSGAPLKNEASPANETPLPLPSSSATKEWTDTFKIPWEKLPQETMHCLLKKNRLNQKMRYKMVRIICKAIFKVYKYPLQRQIEEIAKTMWKRFPESLCNGENSNENPRNEYLLLTNQMLNRMKTLRREDLKNPKLSEDKKHEEWQSKNFKKYGKKLDTDLAPPNFKSTSSVHSAKSSSKSCVTSAPSFSFASSAPSLSYTPSIQNAMVHTSLTPSTLYNSIMPGVKSYISSAASDNSTTSSSCPSNHDIASPSADGNFVIPWHKLSEELLVRLERGEELSLIQRRDMVRVVGEEFFNWELKSLDNISEESKKIAKQMFQKYPSSLSNARFGKPGGKTSSSTLATFVSKNLSNKIRTLKRKQTLAEEASSSKQKTETLVLPDSEEGVLDWAINFRIPWEKMPYALLECLRNRERLSPTLRQEMVRVICSDIQEIEKNPSKECIDFIAKKLCKMYPKSLCDMCGDVVGGKSEFLGRQLLWRIQRVNHTSKSFVHEKTSIYATAYPDDLDTVTSSDSLNELVDVNTMNNMEVDNVVHDSMAITYPNSMNVNGYYDLNTNSYSAIADYISTDFTSTLANNGNNAASCIHHIEQIIKREVTEQDQQFVVERFPGSEPRHLDGEIL